MPKRSRIPTLTRDNALFLDIDGTLLDIAPTPDAVQVPAGLRELLRSIAVLQNGAVALISGRSLEDIDRLMGPGLPVAAEHGAVVRDQTGRILECVPRPASLQKIAIRLRDAVSNLPGTLLEEKRFGIALHWRGAPQHAAMLSALASDLVATEHDLTLQPAHQAMEIRAAGPDKGLALAIMMRQQPFTGRRPVFIGDDVTDEVAIEAAKRLGGTGLHVARNFGGSTASVRAWLSDSLRNGHV